MTDNTKSIGYTPPIQMLRFVEALLSDTVRGNKTKAEEVSGVERQQFYYYYKKHPAFREWYSQQCQNILGMNEAIPPLALLSQIVKGDTQAIRTYYELIGKLKVRSNNVNVGVNIENNIGTGQFEGEDKEFAEATLRRFAEKFEK